MMKTTLFTTLAVSATLTALPSEKRHNVLFIAVDDLKPLIGAYGDALAITPNLDRLAARGTIFTHAYCQQAVSAATRASLLTGWCPDRTGVWDLQTLIRDVNPDVTTMPEYFARNGYVTYAIGKIYDPRSVDRQHDERSWSEPYERWQDRVNKEYQVPANNCYQSPETWTAIEELSERLKKEGMKPGEIRRTVVKTIKPSTECVDVPDDAYMDGAVADGAVRFIRGCDRNRAHFWAVGFKQPHLPFCAPKRYWDMYERNKMPLARFRQRAADSPSFAYTNSGELTQYTDIPALASFSDVYNLELPDDKARELIHGYYAAVTYMDAQLGKVLDALAGSGFDDNTVIVLWGDHGWHLGDHGLWNKHTNFEQAVRVPLMICAPGIAPSKVDRPVEFLDIFPTLCELTGLEIPRGLDGQSLSGLMRDAGSPHRSWAASQYPRGSRMGYTIRSERYRYTVWYAWKDRKLDIRDILAEELYDYANDPLETRNVIQAPGYAEATADMRSLFGQYASERLRQAK